MAVVLRKLATVDLATVLSQAALPAQSQESLHGCVDIADALERLQAAGLVSEAVRLLAHALPKREGVWWACMCAAATAPHDLAESDRLAREYAELWVRQQSDATRREAMAHAEAGGCLTAEAWAGIAAFWSGDSTAPPGKPAIAPLPEQAGSAIAAAVTLASVRGEGSTLAERLQRFLDSGRDIASGGQGRM